MKPELIVAIAVGWTLLGGLFALFFGRFLRFGEDTLVINRFHGTVGRQWKTGFENDRPAAKPATLKDRKKR
jgi:hypothetical protein